MPYAIPDSLKKLIDDAAGSPAVRQYVVATLPRSYVGFVPGALPASGAELEAILNAGFVKKYGSESPAAATPPAPTAQSLESADPWARLDYPPDISFRVTAEQPAVEYVRHMRIGRYTVSVDRKVLYDWTSENLSESEFQERIQLLAEDEVNSLDDSDLLDVVDEIIDTNYSDSEPASLENAEVDVESYYVNDMSELYRVYRTYVEAREAREAGNDPDSTDND